MAATAKFFWDRALVIDVLKDIINRNRENRNRAANKALALAGQPKRKGRPPKTRLEEAREPVVLPTMPPRDAPLPAAYSTRPKQSTPAQDTGRPETPVFVGGAVARRRELPPIATHEPGKPANSRKLFDYSLSVAGHVAGVKFALPFQRWLGIVDALVAKYDPDNDAADDEAGYIYHVPSAFGKQEVRIARDDEVQYNVFIARVKGCAVLVGEEGAIPVHKVGFPRGRSASAEPSLPLATPSASAAGPSHRKRTRGASTPETPHLPRASTPDYAHLPRAYLGVKRQRTQSPMNLRRGRSSGKPEPEKLPEPRNPRKAKAALSKQQKNTHEKRVAKLASREV